MGSEAFGVDAPARRRATAGGSHTTDEEDGHDHAALAADPEHVEVARRAARAGVILVEDRSFVQRVA